MVCVEAVPVVKSGDSSRNNKQIADKTFVDERWVRWHKPRARSYCGIPVEASGKIWGVLVLDSRKPHGIDQEKAGESFTGVAQILGQLVTRA